MNGPPMLSARRIPLRVQPTLQLARLTLPNAARILRGLRIRNVAMLPAIHTQSGLPITSARPVRILIATIIRSAPVTVRLPGKRPARLTHRARTIRRIAIRILLHNPRVDTTRPARNTSARIIPSARPVRRPVIFPAAHTTPAQRSIPDCATAATPTARASAASAARGGGKYYQNVGLKFRDLYT